MGEKAMQGEGNRDADRRYREEVQRSVGTEENRKAARAAKRAIEGSEAEDLAAAEKQARRKGKAAS